MTAVREAVFRVLRTVAPEVDPAVVDPGARLRDELDLDSMAWLAFVQGIHKELGIEIPEREYQRLRSLDDCVAWLEQRQPVR